VKREHLPSSQEEAVAEVADEMVEEEEKGKQLHQRETEIQESK